MKKGPDALIWTTEADKRLQRVPAGFMRDASRDRVESYARKQGVSEITLDVCEAALTNIMSMMSTMFGDKKPAGTDAGKDEDASACPFDVKEGSMGACPFNADDTEVQETEAQELPEKKESRHIKLIWTEEGEERMKSVPEGFMRDLTRKRVEAFARRTGVSRIDNALVDAKYAHWGTGSAMQHAEMEWEKDALERVQRIPDFVRGMVIKEIERCAREIGSEVVGQAALDRASHAWETGGTFHSDMFPEQYKEADKT